MCAKVTEVEHALEDVKELLSGSSVNDNEEEHGAAATQEWEREWITIVQDVVEKDAGWK